MHAAELRRLALAAALYALAAHINPAAAADCAPPAKSAETARSARAVFGTFFSEAPNPRSPLAADLDGDGKPDEVYALVVRAQGRDDCVMPGVALVNPWNAKASSPRGGSAAVGIRLASGARFVFHDPEFFTSPIWTAKTLPLAVIKRGSREHREFTRQAAGLRHDIVVLGTEAGIDIALYWDGKRFQLLQPKETP